MTSPPEKDEVDETPDTNGKTLPPQTNPPAIVPDKGWAWLILLASFSCNIFVGGVLYSFGLFFLEILDHYGESRAVTAWVGSTTAGTYAAIGPLATVMTNKFSCRVTTIVGGLLAFAGFMISTFSPNIWVMIFTYGLIAGIGFGFVYLPGFIMISNYFVKYRALATGIASSGSGVGTLLFAPLCSLLINTYAWKGALWILSAIVANACVMGFIYRPLPTRLEKGVKKKAKLFDLGLLKEPACALVCLATFSAMIGYYIPIVFIPDFTESIGLGRSKGAVLIAIIGLANTMGRVLSGVIINLGWIKSIRLYVTGFLLGGIVTIIVPWLTYFPLLCIFAVIFGLSFGGYVSLGTIILQEYLGVESISSSFGFLSLFRGIGTFLSAPLAGAVYGWTGNHTSMFIIAGVTISLAGVVSSSLGILQDWYVKRKRSKEESGSTNCVEMVPLAASDV